jgi:hypothetical protein
MTYYIGTLNPATFLWEQMGSFNWEILACAAISGALTKGLPPLQVRQCADDPCPKLHTLIHGSNLSRSRGCSLRCPLDDQLNQGLALGVCGGNNFQIQTARRSPEWHIKMPFQERVLL